MSLTQAEKQAILDESRDLNWRRWGIRRNGQLHL